jgi:hypothetical protein
MADDIDNTPFTPTAPVDSTLSPVLQNAAQSFDNDDARSWATPILQRLQQHANQNAVVDANTGTSRQFVNDVNGVKQNLIGTVQDDPSSAHLAMDLAPQLLAPFFARGAAMGMDPDVADQAHSETTDHVQTEVARAAIMRMADLHSDAAKNLMGSLSGYLKDGDTNVLGNYIDTLQVARNADNAAATKQLASQQQRGSAVAAYQFGSSLLDPRTESVAFPTDYLQSLVRNPNIQSDDKIPLFEAFNRLNATGDVNASDPYAVASVLGAIGDPNRAVTHGDIVSHVGQDMRYVDAVMMHGLNLQRTPEGISAVQQLGRVVQDAQGALASGGDRAGNAAYSRFVNWLLPAYRRTGTAGLNPASENYLFNTTSYNSFAPAHEDAVAPITPSNRPSLGQLFSADTRPNLDEKMRRLDDLRQENTQPVAPPSGNFFQRKLEESQPKSA